MYVFVLCKTLRTVFFSARLRPLHFLHNEFVPGRQNERHDSRYATIAYLTKRTDYYIYAAAVAVSRIPKHRPAAIVIVPTIYRSTTGIIKKESSKRTTRTVSRYTGVPNTSESNFGRHTYLRNGRDTRARSSTSHNFVIVGRFYNVLRNRCTATYHGITRPK